MSFHVVTVNTKSSNNPAAALAYKNNFLEEKNSAPTVFGFQELDRHASRSNFVNVPALLAQSDDFVFAKAIAFDPDSTSQNLQRFEGGPQKPWEYGVGLVASQCVIKESHRVFLGPEEQVFWERSSSLEYPWEREPRVAIISKIQIDDALAVWVGNAHFAYAADRSLPSEFRAAQIDVLTRWMDELIPKDAPVVLMADFNATPGNTDLQPFYNRFVRVPIAVPTKITKNGNVQVDHIFYRNLQLKSFAIRPTTFSDHSGVTAEFDFVK